MCNVWEPYVYGGECLTDGEVQTLVGKGLAEDLTL